MDSFENKKSASTIMVKQPPALIHPYINTPGSEIFII